MFAAITSDGKYAGHFYPEMQDGIMDHHTAINETFIEIDELPREDDEGLYGSPTPELLEAYRIKKSNAKNQAYLNSTDWYVLRKVETDKAIPAEVLTQRAEARAALGR